MKRAGSSRDAWGVFVLVSALVGSCSPAPGGMAGVGGGSGGSTVQPTGMRVGFAGQTIIQVLDTVVTGQFVILEADTSNQFQINFTNADGRTILPRTTDFVSAASNDDTVADFETQGAFSGRVVGVANGVTTFIFRYMTSSTNTVYVSPPVPVVVTSQLR